MKTLRLALFGVIFFQLLSTWSIHAQVTARRLTQRLAPTGTSPHTNAAGARPAPAPLQAPSSVTAAPSSPAGAARPTPVYTPVRVIQPPLDPAKVKANKEDALRKTVEFQKKRADEGSESAQYELGVRYLKGDGVEKDEAMGRKWLQESAKNGYGAASQKLEEIGKVKTSPKEGKPEK